MAFTISISITGDEKDYTAAVKAAQTETAKLTQQTEASNRGFDNQEKAVRKAHGAMIPFMAVSGQLTALLQQQFGPAAAIAVSTLDRFVAVAGAARAGGQGLMTALAAGIGAALNPWTLALVAAAAAIAYFVDQSQKAKVASEQWSSTITQVNGQLNALRATNDIERSNAQIETQRSLAIEGLKKQLADGALAANLYADHVDKLNHTFDDMKTAATTKIAKDFTDSLIKQRDAVAQQIIMQEKGAVAAADFAASIVYIDAAQKGLLNDTTRPLIADWEKMSKGLASLAEDAKRAAVAEQNLAGVEKELKELQDVVTAGLDKRFEREKQLAELEGQLIEARGGSAIDAQRARLQATIQALQNRLDDINASRVAGDPNLVSKQIEVAQAQMQHLGDVTIDIGQHVTDTMKTIFDGLISGTLKGVDVVKAATGFVGNIVTDIFSQVIKKKLSFETTLLSNVQGLPSQINSAVASGESSAGAPGGGGFLSSIFGGGSSSGGGGLGSGLLSAVGALGKIFGAGNPLGAAIGGFSAGGLAGNGMTGNILSSVGSLAGSLLSSTAIGESIMTGVFDLLTAGGTSFLGFGGAAAAGFAGELIGDFLLPGIGSIIGILLSFLMKTAVPEATIKIKTAFDGLSLSPYGFMAGQAVSEVVKASNVPKQMQNAIRTQTESIAETVVGGVGDLLNILPKEIQKQVEPLISASNKAAEALLTFKISAPVDEFAGKVKKFMGQLTYRLLAAYSDPLIEALRLELDKIGLPFPDFTPSEIPVSKKPKKNEPVIGQPTDLPSQFIDNMMLYISQQKKKEQGQATSDVMDAEQKVFEMAEQLRAIAPIMTEEQKQFVGAGFANVLAAGSPAEVTAALDRFQRQFGPLLDFLQKALQESADLFGRGIMAALDAVNESTAMLNFNKSLGEGAKDILFQGITEALTNAAQFQTFLAPIQQLIHQFIQNTVDTGQPPDIAAFRAALLPLVEAFTSRVELLQPLIAELNAFGIDIKDALSPLTGPIGGTIINVTVNGNISGEEDAEALGNSIGRFLSGATLPN